MSKAEKAEVVVRDETQVPQAPAGETAAIIQMIERAARDQTVDVNKMRELLAMRKEIVEEQAKQAFNAAMTLAQTEMRPIAADAENPQTHSKYATYLALDKAIRPIYVKHGFALSFNTEPGAPENHVRVVCDVSHKGGYSRRYQFDMPADGKGAKGNDVMTKTHAAGAAATYGTRYLLKMIFNIVVGDDDGNAASAADLISDEQVVELNKLIDDLGAVKERVIEHAAKLAKTKITKIEEIRARDYDKVVQALNAWARKQRGM